MYDNRIMYAQVGKQETEQFERSAIIAALSWLCDPFRTMDNLQSGDTVQLKSGGPVMTVKDVRGGELLCEWFDPQGKHQVQLFKPASLKKVEMEGE